MKQFNPIFISVDAFRNFFPLSAQHFSIVPSQVGKRERFDLVQMPKAQTCIYLISKIIPGGTAHDAHRHQLELYRERGHNCAHLFTVRAVNITHPHPCVLIGAVRFSDMAEFDLTREHDEELQGLNYERALKCSAYFAQAVSILGKRPEEMRHPSEESRVMMEQMGQPIERLFEQIEKTPLPKDYPRKGDIQITEILTSLDLKSLCDAEYSLDFAATINEVTGAGLGAPDLRMEPALVHPLSAETRGDGNVIPVTFGGRKPSFTPGDGGH
jgi:hypothetical protein